MVFFILTRVRRKKMRARESRQTAEDQRSIVGSIGYIAGNLGYMEGNLSSMDYTYGGAATHYPLWKPPSGYFPRGEAPPPYDEAVAISQAEALSAQCAAAAAAAQVAATQRATMGINTVELQNTELTRRAQATQQIQHHNQTQTTHTQLNHQPTLQQQAHVMAPQNQQNSQTHQITQSTTNLINININSGGNITTIATGENHQPPYSLQDENITTTGLMQQQQQQQQQQSTNLASQQMQLQQHQQQQLIAAATNGSNGHNNGRLHVAQSNSICVQTMTPLNPAHQQQQQQQSLSSTQNSGCQSTKIVTTNSNNVSRPTQSDCGYKNCHLSVNNSGNTLSRRLQRNTNEPLQQYVVDVEVNVGNANNRAFNSLPACSNNNQPTDVESILSPTQFSNNLPSIDSATSTPAGDQLSISSSNQNIEVNNSINLAENCTQLNTTSHNTLPLQPTQTNKTSNNTNGNMKNSSSSSSSTSSNTNFSKRYHRTMPRYYAVGDPLSSRETTVNSNTLNTANKSTKTSTNGSHTSANSTSLAAAKKSTCQCPIQHVPMSYMGSTQLNNAQNVSNNAFFTVLSNKLSASASSSPTTSQHSQRLQTHSNTNSLNYQHRPKSSQSLNNHGTRDAENIPSANTTMKRSLNTHCNYETKIATISTGELHNASVNTQSHHQPQQQQQQQQQHQQQQHHHHSHGHAHHHGHHSSLLPPPQHHDDSSPIVLGRVTKRSSSSSSGDRLRSTSTGSTRSSLAESVGITSPAAAAYLNSKVDAYLNFAHGNNHHLKANDLINPALPPKLHKSLTNLKATTSTSVTAAAAAAASTASNAATNTYNQRKVHQNTENSTTASNNMNNSNTTSTNCNNFSTSSASSSSSASMANTTSVQTIYTLSKPHHTSISSSSPSSSSALSNNTTTTTIIGLNSSTHTPSTGFFQATRKADHDHIIKITQQPPSLTLPLNTTSTISSFTSSTSKLNSSTFYPLQNNVTYTLPKNSGGKMSLNSTINSVVSKVPSVISLPSTTSGHDSINTNNTVANNVSVAGENHNYSPNLHHHDAAAAATATAVAAALISKSTTLPKILRTKRESHNTTINNTSQLNFNATNNHLLTNNSSTTTSNSTTNYAVSQCSMPAYPKQYTLPSSNNAAACATSSSAQSKNHTHHTTTATATNTTTSPSPSQPTNINMQTQTITSTLAANYCPEDSHLNPHHIIATNTTSTSSNNIHSSSSSSSTTTTNNFKQLPVCTTSKNCLNPKEHFLPNDTSLDDDYLSECENCKIAQSSKYYLDAEILATGPQETMTLQRKSMEECKDEPETGYYRISHTLPTNSKKSTPVKSNNRYQWFSTIPTVMTSSEEDK